MMKGITKEEKSEDKGRDWKVNYDDEPSVLLPSMKGEPI